MDYIKVNEESDQIQVIDQEDGVPVKILEEKLSVSEFADSMTVETQDDHLVLQDSTDNIKVSDDMDVVRPYLGEVFIQNKVTTEYEAELEVPYSTRVDFENDDLIYKAWAAPGSSEAAPVWRVQRITFVGTDEDVVIEWADGDGNFDNIWDDHLGLSYS